MRLYWAFPLSLYYKIAAWTLGGWAWGYTKAGSAWLSAGRYKAALKCYRTALRDSPDYVYALQGVASAHTGLNDYESARDVLEKAMRLESNNSVFKMQWSMNLFHRGLHQDAKNNFEEIQVNQLSPHEKAYHDQIATFLK